MFLMLVVYVITKNEATAPAHLNKILISHFLLFFHFFRQYIFIIFSSPSTPPRTSPHPYPTSCSSCLSLSSSALKNKAKDQYSKQTFCYYEHQFLQLFPIVSMIQWLKVFPNFQKHFFPTTHIIPHLMRISVHFFCIFLSALDHISIQISISIDHLVNLHFFPLIFIFHDLSSYGKIWFFPHKFNAIFYILTLQSKDIKFIRLGYTTKSIVTWVFLIHSVHTGYWI